MQTHANELNPLDIAEIADKTGHDRRTVRKVLAGQSPAHLVSTARILRAAAKLKAAK